MVMDTVTAWVPAPWPFYVYQNNRIMKRNHVIAILTVSGALAFSCSPGSRHDESSTEKAAKEANDDKFQTHDAEADAKFVVEAVAANYADIGMAKLAAQRSDNAEVKEVAKSLEHEHNKLLKDLQALAGNKAITLPSQEDESSRRTIENLNDEQSIKDFNTKWCSEMQDAHEKCIRSFEAQLEKTTDEDLKALINQSLPELREHLDKIKACHEKVKNV